MTPLQSVVTWMEPAVDPWLPPVLLAIVVVVVITVIIGRYCCRQQPASYELVIVDSVGGRLDLDWLCVSLAQETVEPPARMLTTVAVCRTQCKRWNDLYNLLDKWDTSE